MPPTQTRYRKEYAELSQCAWTVLPWKARWGMLSVFSLLSRASYLCTPVHCSSIPTAIASMVSGAGKLAHWGNGVCASLWMEEGENCLLKVFPLTSACALRHGCRAYTYTHSKKHKTKAKQPTFSQPPKTPSHNKREHGLWHQTDLGSNPSSAFSGMVLMLFHSVCLRFLFVSVK